MRLLVRARGGRGRVVAGVVVSRVVTNFAAVLDAGSAISLRRPTRRRHSGRVFQRGAMRGGVAVRLRATRVAAGTSVSVSISVRA